MNLPTRGQNVTFFLLLFLTQKGSFLAAASSTNLAKQYLIGRHSQNSMAACCHGVLLCSVAPSACCHGVLLCAETTTSQPELIPV